jgi:hypothetical protein
MISVEGDDIGTVDVCIKIIVGHSIVGTSFVAAMTASFVVVVRHLEGLPNKEQIDI